MVFPSYTRVARELEDLETRIAWRMPDGIFRMPSKQLVKGSKKKRSKNRLLTKSAGTNSCYLQTEEHYGALLWKNV